MIVPSHYEKNTKPYKLLYVLHGAWAEPADYLKKTKIAEYSERHNLILVLPSSHLHQGNKKVVNSWYINSTLHQQMQWQNALRELDSTLKQKYKVQQKSGITGLSMGGYGAMYSAIHQPDLFNTVSTLSAVFQLPEKPIEDQNWLFQHEAKNPVYDLIQQVSLLKNKPLRFLISCGTDDKFYKDGQNTNMFDTMKKTGLNVMADFKEGKHSWTYWDSILPAHLKFHDLEQKQ
jgi:S-formylglutathione hydrolase FrmB